MPIYQFRNKETKEVTETVMHIAELDAFEAAHPELEYVFSPIPISDMVRLGLKKPDPSFRELVKTIHKKAGGNRHHHWD